MGFSWVFLLGFSPSQKLQSATKNKPSAAQHPSVVDQYLANKVSLGWVAGPFTTKPFPNLHVSSFGVIPKRGQPRKWHLIMGLSSPGRASVNDGIDPDKFTLHYITLDQVIRLVSKLGPRALTARFDVEAAYRNVPVHPSYHVLLGMKWRDQFYVDLVFPFGPRSAPFIFNSTADMVNGSLSIPTRFQTSTITWTTSLLPVLLSPSSVHITWLLLGKSVNGLVYLCILPNVWALLRCLSSWGSSSTLSIEWHVFPRKSC